MKCSLCNEIDHNVRRCPYVDHAGLYRKKNGAPLQVEIDQGVRQDAPPVPKRTHMYPEIFEALKDAPKDALARTEWAQEILCTLAKETAQGRGNQLLNNEIRRLLEAVGKMTPKERIWEAETLIKRDRIKKKPKPTGPSTQKARPSKGPLR
ncbi:hypothetical protein LCGC14_2023400 [marine sediment metagenome]|uniref:Uncharacterized protein n=2 Tax=marine sediment metagenome TaxID=412755 RepID=A0A0F9HTX0_9ZZZZ